MMTKNTLIKTLVGVNEIKIKNVQLDTSHDGVKTLIATVEPFKNKQCRCPYCDKKLPKYDTPTQPQSWRGLDCGGVLIDIRSTIPRISCPEHGVVTAAVPWAFHNSRFTKEFDLSVAWLSRTLNKSAISQYMRISWASVGCCIICIMNYLEPNKSSRFTNLKRIGIDETSYSKGHKYITTVIDHDTNTVVWGGDKHGKTILESFFKHLTGGQRAGIEVVSGDGARWIVKTGQ